MPPTITKTIKDRNLAAYLLANGFACDFVHRPHSEELDAEFLWDEDADRSCQEYLSNHCVPVQSFIAACRYIGQRIKEHRQRIGGRP